MTDKTTSKQAKAFVDSNIWLYTYQPVRYPKKAHVAQELVKDYTNNLAVSSQVIIEVGNILTKKLKLDESMIRDFINLSYDRYEVINVNREVLSNAYELRQKYMFSYFDSLIIAAALLTDSTILYSEDMQHSLVVEKQLTIINPFIGV